MWNEGGPSSITSPIIVMIMTMTTMLEHCKKPPTAVKLPVPRITVEPRFKLRTLKLQCSSVFHTCVLRHISEPSFVNCPDMGQAIASISPLHWCCIEPHHHQPHHGSATRLPTYTTSRVQFTAHQRRWRTHRLSHVAMNRLPIQISKPRSANLLTVRFLATCPPPLPAQLTRYRRH
jgi:hypothetical protein